MFHVDSVVLILRVVCQRGLDAGRSAMVVNSFARTLLVAAAGGAAGHAQEQWHRTEADDQAQYFQGFARVYRCFFISFPFIF